MRQAGGRSLCLPVESGDEADGVALQGLPEGGEKVRPTGEEVGAEVIFRGGTR